MAIDVCNHFTEIFFTRISFLFIQKLSTICMKNAYSHNFLHS